MSSKVKVAVRVRPFNRREIDLGTKCVVDMDDTQTILFSSASRDRKNTKTFAFDHCFWSMEESNNKYASQEKVYKCLGADVLENSFEGYNACIFAYGQTGSGKTYTMMGSQNQTGLIPRLCNELFDRISSNEDENITYKVEVSYIEIYNEKVRDLLCPRGNQATLRVREHKILGPYVEGLTKLVVSSFKDIENLMIEGNKSRTVAATNMNTESSRSHAVFNIVLTRSEYDKETESIGEKVSKLSLVDLAGSERASKSGAEGERLKEGSNINRSLVTLGQVISSLAESGGKGKKALHVPYRDSVLTWLLKDNLGGNSKTVMVATVSPAADNYEETLSTLRYADRAKRIVNHAVVNEDPNAKIIRELREEVDRLKRMLAAKIAGKSHIVEPGETTIEIKEMLSESEKLMSECTMTWEQKEKQTEKIQQERHKALEEMGISVQSSGIAVEKSKFYLVNLNADPSMNELLVYYLKEHTIVGRPDATHAPDIQLGGLGILQEHCQLDIEGNEVYVTPLAKTGTCVNGRLVEEKTQLKHGDRILWGNNHYFRINCPRLPGSEQQVEQTVDFQFAQTELMMNEMSAGPLKESVKALEEQYKAEKQGALDRQRQMYEEKIEELRNQMVPMGRQSMGERTVSIGSFSSGYGSSRMSWCDDSRENLIQFERKPLVLREEVIKANTLVREANQLSEEMGKETEFAVTLQIPTSSLSFGRSRPGFSSEVAIVVKHKSKGTQIWSLEKLSNKIYDMRDLYNQCVEDDIPFSETDENLDLFFEVECHTLIGVANVFLECLLHDVNHEYAAPIISQQGEVCGRLKVEVSRISEKAQKKKSREAEGGAGETSSDEEDDLLVIHDDNGDDDDDELVKGSQMHVEVKVVEAYDLPPALCNYVFCQYKFWNDDNTIVVPPINASISQPGPKTNTMIFEHKQLFDMEVTDEFVEYASEGSLAIEVWGNRMKGFDSQSKVMLNWNVEPQQKGLHDRWGELLRKMQLWVEILEINDQGVYAPVELHIQKDNLTGGVFQLRQGHSRRIVVRVQPVPRAGSLPVVCDIISAVYIGSVSMRTKNQQPLDSYQEKDLAILREKWSTSLMKRREYLDEQIHSLIDKQDKSASDKERESWMIDQWVCLTEERNAVLVPIRGSGIPGAPPLEGTVPLGMEKYNPVIFLDLQNDDVRSGCMEEGGPAGVDSTLVFENSDHMMELPIINYDQKQVSATVLWDSSIHDSVFLNRVTQSHERVYLILKIIVRLASPIAMDLVLRKRISVKIYKKQSWKDSLLRKITKDIITRSGVTYELVSHIPRQPGEETEERESLAQMAALAVGEGEEEDESVLRKYSKGISHVESLLALDRLRQEVMVKEKLAAIGKPLRKFASTPNLAAASGDLSFGFSGKDDRFDSPESHKLWNTRANNRSDFVLPGSFTDPRPIRPTKEEILLDLSQMNEKFSSSPTTSGVVLRNSGGGSSNSRPSSLLMELEPLEEDESERGSDDLSHANLVRYLKPFSWLGRRWELLAFKGKKRDRMQDDQPDAEQKYVFFATSPWEKEGDEVLRMYPGLPDIWNAAQQHELAAASFPNCTADEARRELVPKCAELKLLAESAAKYNKRLLLGFSSATGTIVCRADQIREVPDLVSHSGEVLTDGCGRIGMKLAHRIAKHLVLVDIPAVFQIRLGSGKGLLQVDLGLDDADGLYLSKSMVKWLNDWTTCSEEDRRIEVVTWSKPSEEAALNTQIITGLESSGVPLQALLDIQQTHISAMLAERLGGDVESVASRLSCQDGAGIALQACDAGIDPRQEPALLANIWRYSVEKALDDAKTNASYKSPGARRAFIVPDFARKLLPGEAVFRTQDKGYIEGEAIIARNPCTAPWDVQKIRLLSTVEVLERFGGYPTCLHDNVLLLSAHESCDFSPAHVLAGGDYDGDTVLILTDTSLVQHFKNTAYEHAKVCQVHDTLKKLVPSVDCPVPGSESPFWNICKAAAEDSKKDLVVGGLANRWHFLADQFGARHESAIKAGLAHQLALDGKIDSRIPMRQIITALNLPDHKVPHWHRSATRGALVVQSASALGKLYTNLNIEKLHDTYREKYGNSCLYEAIRKPRVVNFDSFQIKVAFDDVRVFMPEAQQILRAFREKRQECRVTKKWDELDNLFQSQLHGCSNPPLLAAAVYRQQCDDFLKSAADKNLKDYLSVELALEPAWRLCPRQLCEYVVKFVVKDPYPMSAAVRPKLRYKPAKRSDAP